MKYLLRVATAAAMSVFVTVPAVAQTPSPDQTARSLSAELGRVQQIVLMWPDLVAQHDADNKEIARLKGELAKLKPTDKAAAPNVKPGATPGKSP